MLGLASLFVEATLLALSATAIALQHANDQAAEAPIVLQREPVLETSSSVA
jgi:hypothetical protein